MTPPQVELLLLLISADRRYHAKRDAGYAGHPDDRGVEIGWINGIDPRTARSLEAAGLIELINLNTSQTWAFLGSYIAIDQLEPNTSDIPEAGADWFARAKRKEPGDV